MSVIHENVVGRWVYENVIFYIVLKSYCTAKVAEGKYISYGLFLCDIS